MTVIGELNLNPDKEGDKVNALDKSINLLVNFIESGGEVDFVLPENIDEEEGEEDSNIVLEYQKLQDSIQKIRQLESKLKLLEDGFDDE